MVEGRTLNQSIENKNKGYIALLFLFSPLLSLIVAVKNFKKTWAKNVLWAFVAFYGYTFVISNNGMDANRYRDSFLNLARSDVSFLEFFGLIFSGKTSEVDLAEPLITFLVSRFTDNYHFLFAAFGLVFGYFYSRNIWFLLERTETKLQKLAVIVVFAFAVVVGFWELNGFRFWSATHVFFYGAMPFIFDGKKKGLFFVLLSAAFHFSFFLPISIFIIYLIFRNKLVIYFWIFVGSLFISELNLQSAGTVLSSVLPKAFFERTEIYTDEEFAEKRQSKGESRNLRAQIYGLGLRLTIFTMLIVIYFNFKKYFPRDKKGLYNLYNFSLMFLGIANIIGLIPSGSRFVRVGSLFAVAMIFFYIYFVPRDKLFYRVLLMFSPLLLFYMIMTTRVGTDTIGYVTLFSNPVGLLFAESDLALIELLK